jgi:hypothetical protein
MEAVIQAVEHVRAVPGTLVDCGIGQGENAYLAYVRRQTLEVLDISPAADDWYVAEFQRGFAEVQAWVGPDALSRDYAFFLEYFAGLVIDRDDYYFAVYGIGLMTEHWYSSVTGDDGLFEEGFLKIGVLAHRKKARYVDFFLDLAGTIRQDCVIGINDRGLERADYASILQDPYAHTDRWTKLADSFTEWLEQAAATSGTFGYI